MDNKIIELKYDRKYFEEIYYNKDNVKAHNSNTLFTLISLFCVLLTIYALYITKNIAWMLIIGLFSSYIYYEWYTKILVWIKWKIEVKKFLNGLDKIKENKLILGKNTFSLIQDTKETMEKWSELKKVEIEDDYILFIVGITPYLFPKKSMNLDEFQFLGNILTENFKKQSPQE